MLKRILAILICLAVTISTGSNAADSTCTNQEFVADYNQLHDQGVIEELNDIQAEFSKQMSIVLINGTISHAQFESLYAYLNSLNERYTIACDRLEQIPVVTPEMDTIKKAALSLYLQYKAYYSYFIYGVVRQNQTIIYTAIESIRGADAQHTAFDDMYKLAGEKAGQLQKPCK